MLGRRDNCPEQRYFRSKSWRRWVVSPVPSLGHRLNALSSIHRPAAWLLCSHSLFVHKEELII